MTRLDRIRAEGTDKLRDIAWLVETVGIMKEAILDLLCHGVELDDERLKYEVVQLDRSSIEAGRKALARLEEPDAH